MSPDDLKPGDDVTWTEETRDGPVARVGCYQGAETLGSVRCGVVWTHQNGAAMVIALDRLTKAKRRA